MAIKLIQIALLVTAVQFFLGASCNKENPRQCRDGYSFAVTSEWSPQKETYNVGDTIYIESSFPKTITDLVNPSLVVDYSNSVGIGGNIVTSELDTSARIIKDAMSKFEAIPSIGNIRPISPNPEKGLNFTYHEQHNYAFKAALKAKSKGVFLLYVTDCVSAGLRGKNCTNANFGMTVINSDKHFGLYQYAMQQAPDEIQKRTMYCFRVQ